MSTKECDAPNRLVKGQRRLLVLEAIVGAMQYQLPKVANAPTASAGRLRSLRAKGRDVRVAIGADHAGYELKEFIIELLKRDSVAVIDLGTNSTDSVDYPDFAAAVGNAVRNGDAERGIVVCGSGAGASIAANKMDGIRAALAHDTYTAHQAVEHDDSNVLCLGSRVIGQNVATELVRAFLGAQFTGEERHVRRLGKILDLEANG